MFRDKDPTTPATLGDLQSVWLAQRHLWKIIRNLVVVAMLLVAIGTAAGLWSIQNQNETACWDRYNGRVVLRALIFSQAGSGANPDAIQDPELRLLLLQSQKNSQRFYTLTRQLLPLPDCEGANPEPIEERILSLARVPEADRPQIRGEF